MNYELSNKKKRKTNILLEFFLSYIHFSSNDSIKPILVHDHSSSRQHDHHVQVAVDDPTLSPEEQGSHLLLIFFRNIRLCMFSFCNRAKKTIRIQTKTTLQ